MARRRGRRLNLAKEKAGFDKLSPQEPELYDNVTFAQVPVCDALVTINIRIRNPVLTSASHAV